jgi:hypothetical protein
MKEETHGKEWNKGNGKMRGNWTYKLQWEISFHAKLTCSLMDVCMQLIELWIHFLKLIPSKHFRPGVSNSRPSSLFHAARLRSRIATYAMCGSICPVFINFKFQIHVKCQLVYRCFVFQLNKGEMYFSKIHICVCWWENRGTKNTF